MTGVENIVRSLASIAGFSHRGTSASRRQLGVFSELFDRADIKVLDIGARGGPLDWVRFLAPFSSYYACEPDKIARVQLKCAIEQSHSWKQVVIVPEALASTRGPVTLHLTRHEGMSSLFKPNMDVVRAFGLEDEFAVEREVTVGATTLQEAAVAHDFRDLSLIKVDTQGTELSILQSGEDLLIGPVQGVFVEVEFREFYRGQPLFSEVELYLRGLGFELISLEPVTRRRIATKFRVGYSRREVTWAHAMFIKQAPDIATVDEDTLFRRTAQQVAIAMAREQFDLAAERLAGPQFQAALYNRRLKIGPDEFEACVRRLYSGWVYKLLGASSSAVVKHRRRSFFR